MPAKKKTAAKKSIKNTNKDIKAKTPQRKESASKKASKKKAEKPEKRLSVVAIPLPQIPKPTPEPEMPSGPLKDCDHCDATGKCAAGEPYDKGHHQMFGSKIRLTSCIECLENAGEHHNSKKLVVCSYCRGLGKIPE